MSATTHLPYLPLLVDYDCQDTFLIFEETGCGPYIMRYQGISRHATPSTNCRRYNYKTAFPQFTDGVSLCDTIGQLLALRWWDYLSAFINPSQMLTFIQHLLNLKNELFIMYKLLH